jgi:hypothetical protein
VAAKNENVFLTLSHVSCRSARLRRGCIAISHHYDFLKTANVATQASSLDSGEVVVCRVDRNHRLVVLNFFAESIRLLTGSAEKQATP